MPNPFSELMQFDEMCRRLGSDLDLTDGEIVDALLEGETELVEICQTLLDDLDEIDIQQAGLAAKIKQLTERKGSFDRAADRAREFLFKVMDRHPDKKLKLPTATLTMKAAAPKLTITDEGQIPFDLMKSSEPKPDRAAILEELKSGAKVPGCELTNGTPSLQIRRR